MTKLDTETLVYLLRECASGDTELCGRCPYAELRDCSGQLMLDAADILAAVVRLTENCLDN